MMEDDDEIPDLDPLKLFAAQDRAAKDAKAAEERWQKLCKRMLKTPLGRDFIREAIGRYNVMGSVFTERMDALEAARNDGRREVVSDILNSAKAATPTEDTA
jgi:hypothetical protein